MHKLIPHLWYTDKAEEAATFYASVLPNSKVTSVTTMPADNPSGPADTLKVVEFTLMGQPFVAFDGGPLDNFNHAVSFMVECDTQQEIDKLWTTLSKGGSTEPCGWLKDRYGLSWQVVPAKMLDWFTKPDEKSQRAFAAMMKMGKLDIAALERAYRG